MRYIFIVIGHGLGFDGYESWNVKAFFLKEKAEKFRNSCIKADRKYRFKKERFQKHYGYYYYGVRNRQEKTEYDTIVNEIDSKYDGCMADIDYYVEPIELF